MKRLSNNSLLAMSLATAVLAAGCAPSDGTDGTDRDDAPVDNTMLQTPIDNAVAGVATNFNVEKFTRRPSLAPG